MANTPKKQFGKIIIAIIVVLLIGWGTYAELTRKTPVQTAVASKSTIHQYIDERARTTLPHIYHITMPENGRIQPIMLAAGTVVKKGQVIATLDKADLEDAMDESRDIVEAMMNAVNASLAQIKTSQANVDFTEWLWKAQNKLYTKGATSELVEKQARREFLESKISLESTHADAYAMQAYYSSTKLLPLYFGRRLKRTDIQSPIHGIVLKRYVWNKKSMQAGDPLLDVGNLDDLRITADILTEEAVTIRVGDVVSIRGETIGEAPIRGTVIQVQPQGFTKLSSLGVEQQRVPVIIDFQPDDLAALKKNGRTLGLEYRVRVRIFTDEKKNAVIVPRTVLFRGNTGKWQAYVVRAGKTVLVNLEIGIVNDRMAEITKGLSVGDTVIVAPESTLKDGIPVVSKN